MNKLKNYDNKDLVPSKKTGLFVSPVLNKSASFILPLIGLSIGYYGLINTYLGIKSSDGKIEGLDSESIYMNIKYYDEKLQGLDDYVSCKQLPNKTYLYKFKIDKRFENDYLLFYKGKYSEFSNEAKDIICRITLGNHRVKDKESGIYGILYKSPERYEYIENLIGQKLPKDAELCSVMELDSEILEV